MQIGTASAVPSYVGLAPGTVGVYQINFKLSPFPPLNAMGDLPVTVGNFPMTLATGVRFSPFSGSCPFDGVGVVTQTSTSRSVLIPIR